jgi:predicted dienelactone hydrolase
MRAFEVVLILANLSTLVSSFARPPRLIWLGLAGANLAALAVHAALEGVRWQLTCSYLLAIVLTVYALLRAGGKTVKSRTSRVPRGIGTGLKFIAVVLGVALLACTAFLAHALPVFSLPAPTGAEAVGFQYFHLVDESRADPFLAGTAQRRELMIKVYYPAKPNDAVPYARYFNGSTTLMRAFAGFYGLPPFAFDHFALVRTHAKINLAPSDREQAYPVVLFSNGAGTTPEVETAQSEDLASHGYIVVAIDHPYVSAATLFPDRLVTARQATTDFAVPEPAEPITRIMADDDQFVIQQLGELNAGRISPMLGGKLDLDRIGTIGHSVGGATAYSMALRDSRVKAAINLDGAVYVTPDNAQAIAPFLMLANDKYHAQAIQDRKPLLETFADTPEGQQQLRDRYGSKEAYDEQYRKAQRNIAGLADVLQASAGLYTITGSDHMKFTDIGLFFGDRRLRELLQIAGATAPSRCLAIAQALTVAFFDQHLKGVSGDALESVLRTYQELKRIPLH